MIKKIFHTADWHLRNLDRHEEFLESFDLFINSIQSFGLDFDEAIICATGDFFDNHEQVSNEANDLMIQCFKKAIKIHPMIVIVGNHDLPKNRERLDAITPIVKAINNSNLKFSKKSEIFEFKGINFVHYCFLDNFSVRCPSDKNGLYVGLYHALLQNCKNPLDWGFEKKMETYGVGINLFENCDVVLMGDVHFPQEIKHKEYSAYYCGSLYQQNFGEYVNKHGYGVLDINTLNYDFVELNNSYGKYKIKISSIEDLDAEQLDILNISK